MILSICLNCSLDTRYTSCGFAAGAVHTVDQSVVTAGGKGLNLARVAALLGKPVTATGLVGKNELDFFTAAMEEVAVEAKFIPLPAATRRCLNIVDPESNSSTQILERGEKADPGCLDQLLDTVRALAPEVRVICASGSVPPGLPTDAYARLGNLARELGKPFILDARGVHLARGLAAKPFVVKPNQEELAELTGRPLATAAEIAASLEELCAAGIGLAVASLGARGAMAAAAGNIWQLKQPEIKAVNPVGSGDAFVAGLAAGMVENLDIPRCLALAAACGMANAVHPGTGRIDPAQVELFLEQIEIMEGGGR